MIKEKILVVEDDEDIQELIDFNLAREGYHVLKVASGEEALSVENREKPDLVILDLMLPGLDGLEVCRRLKSGQDGGAVPIIMVTAKGEESDIVTGLELGADDYLVKPFSPRILVARVRNVLRRAKGEEAVPEDGVMQRHGAKLSPPYS